MPRLPLQACVVAGLGPPSAIPSATTFGVLALFAIIGLCVNIPPTNTYITMRTHAHDCFAASSALRSLPSYAQVDARRALVPNALHDMRTAACKHSARAHETPARPAHVRALGAFQGSDEEVDAVPPQDTMPGAAMFRWRGEPRTRQMRSDAAMGNVLTRAGTPNQHNVMSN